MPKNRPNIPQKIKTKLWMASGGRCQFDGCNKQLWKDSLDYKEMNHAHIAHIYGWAEKSARYELPYSKDLASDFSNLMLLCGTHHDRIDKPATRDEYSSSRLMKMKQQHEQRITFLTSLTKDKRSHVVLFGSRIGKHESPLRFEKALDAILPHFYPNSEIPIVLGISNFSLEDSDDRYWETQEENLNSLFSQKIESLKGNHEVQHFSIFGLAPQPLLIKLGVLLNDIYSAEVYQLHREPSTWSWLDSDESVEYSLLQPKSIDKIVALKLELSATIIDERITSVLDVACSIWSITHDDPHPDFLKTKTDLSGFRDTMRKTFNKIKAIHGQEVVINVFPAMPVSAAIELGRVWMPKSDLPMIIYDHNYKRDGFYKTISISNL